jgi:hypothetical protein
LGNRADRRQREKGIRVDDDRRRSFIGQVREFIFKGGRSIISTWVENLIGSMSLVPTRVCIFRLDSLNYKLM